MNRWLAKWFSTESLVGKMTGNDENYTPSVYVTMIKNVMGDIDLDQASCSLAQKVVKARHYSSLEDNGLNHSWQGRVFLNPPYGPSRADRPFWLEIGAINGT